MNNQDSSRVLTDEDIDAIIDRLLDRFFKTVGKGFMSFVWVGVFVVLVGLATIGFKYGH